MEGMRSQMVFPLRRKDQVIGVLLLESRSEDPWEQDAHPFLSRLSDHAAIAIANAQLFAQVQAANLAKSEFVSFVSHELKTPMTSIRGYTDLLLGGAMGEVSAGQEEFLQTIRSNVERMGTLVSDLADISRIEAGRLHLEIDAVDFTEVLDEVMRSQRHSLEAKKQQLEIQVPDGLPAVRGDELRLVQILVNLVSNANKYTPEGGNILIRAELPPTAGTRPGPPRWCVCRSEMMATAWNRRIKNGSFPNSFALMTRRCSNPRGQDWG